MFSMFFGAGNVVFPLQLGQLAGDQNTIAIMGMLLTAVGVPFLGLIGMILFDGDFETFYCRIGKVAGLALITLIIAIIGPFGAMPRCITLSHSAIKMFLPNLSLLEFSIISAFIIYGLSVMETKIVSILGYVLSPLLIIALVTIIAKGLFFSPAAPDMNMPALSLFTHGLVQGYNTMDLLATGFFSYIVISTLKANFSVETKADRKALGMITLKSSLIGASLLALIYTGMSYVASFYSTALVGVHPDELMTQIAFNVLGPSFGFTASIAVALACLTTAITLAAVSTDYLKLEVFKDKVDYKICLGIIVVVATLFANLGFAGLMKIIIPMVMICYPAIVVLTICNILYQLFNFKPVKIPFFVTLGLSSILYFV